MRELAVDRFALDRFGIRMSMPAADPAKRQPVTPRFGPDDRFLSILERPSAQVAQRSFFGLSDFAQIRAQSVAWRTSENPLLAAAA